MSFSNEKHIKEVESLNMDYFGSVEYAECGVRSVENKEYGKCGVWKMRSVENEEQ